MFVFVSQLQSNEATNERQLPVRIGKRGFQARIKGDLRIEFGDEKLTSFAGLELVRRFVRALGFASELRRSAQKLGLGGDVSLAQLVLTIVGMLLAGAKRLHHVAFLADDPVFLRFAGLARAPSERSLSRTLKKLTFRTWPELDRLATIVARAGLTDVDAGRWTLDIDGSVLTTGLQVERAERGFNPHHRKNPSYYPILCIVAQTGHVLGHQNRRGNVHDSHGAAEFLRRNVRTVRDELGFTGTVEVRVDGAFFKREFLAACDGCRVDYAVKVPMMPWLNLRAIVKKHPARDWQWVDRKLGVQALDTVLPIDAWNRTERAVIYRKRINHKSPKSHQLDLFNPDDGEWVGVRVIGAFDEGLDDWAPEGDTFEVRRSTGGLDHLRERLGAGFVTSVQRDGGETPTGTLTSPPFVVPEGGLLSMRVGGGAGDATVVRVLVGEREVAAFHGDGDDDLAYVWVDLAAEAGQEARVVVVDRDPTAHVTLDHVVLMQRR